MTSDNRTPRTVALKAKWSNAEGARNSPCSPEAHEIYALCEELERCLYFADMQCFDHQSAIGQLEGELAALGVREDRQTVVTKLLDAAFRALQHDTGPQDPEYVFLRKTLGKEFSKILAALATHEAHDEQKMRKIHEDGVTMGIFSPDEQT